MRSLSLGLVSVPLAPAQASPAAGHVAIVDVVPLDALEPAHVRRTEVVQPGSGAERAFALLREALRRAGCVAIARGDNGARVILRPHGAFLLAEELFSEAELRELAERSAARLDADRVEIELWDGLIARLREQRLAATPRKPLAKAKVISIGDVVRRRRRRA